MPNWALIPGVTLSPVPWRNGLGVSRNIVTRTTEAGALLWQVGIADLVQDAPFSDYPDCDRIFTPIAGDPPPELAFHGGPFEPCPLLVPKPFPGDVPTLSRIPAPGRAFNVIVDRRLHKATVAVLPLPPGSTVQPPDVEVFILHCLAGRLLTGGIPFVAGDSLFGPDQTRPIEAAEDSLAIIASIVPL